MQVLPSGAWEVRVSSPWFTGQSSAVRRWTLDGAHAAAVKASADAATKSRVFMKKGSGPFAMNVAGAPSKIE